MNTEIGFIEVKTAWLKEICEITLENIEKSREERNKELINKHRKRMFIFFGHIETDEEVDCRFRHSSNSFLYPSPRGWGIKKRIKQILPLIDLAETMFVSVEFISSLCHNKEGTNLVCEEDYF